MTLVRRRVSPKVLSINPYEVGVPDPLMVLGGEPQVGGQAGPVGEQAPDRGRVHALVAGGELVDPVIDDLHHARAGRRLEVLGAEDRPVGVLDLGLHAGRDLGQQVAAPVKA
jgi:hypothetical protein